MLEALSVWWARRRFAGVRGEFWTDLAAATRAKRPVLAWLRGLASRAGTTAQGQTAALIARAMSLRPEFPVAAAPYLPGLDRVMVEAAEYAADKAQVYELLAEQVEMAKTLRGQLLGALAIPLLGLALAAVVVGIYGTQVFPEFISIAPLNTWPPAKAAIASLALFLSGWGGLALLALVVVIVAWVLWSLDRYTGPGRRFLDDHVWPWSMVRSTRGVEVVMAVATMLGARVAWETVLAKLRTLGTPWLRWQASLVEQRSRTTRAADPLGSLDTGLLSPSLYYRIVDYADARGDELPKLLLQAARDEAKRVERRMKVFSTTAGVVVQALVAVSFLAMYYSLPQIRASQFR
jgi:type II secretory pathway component PulF